MKIFNNCIHIGFLIVCLLLSFYSKAQYFSTGQDPARIKWRQINTDHFQLIYPEEYEDKAQQVAFVFEKVYEYGYKSLDHTPKKISVVFHTHTVKSNGLVAWSPKRVELFTTPHQKIFAQDWLNQLAIHEFRHVVQMDKIQSELPGILPVLFGEQAAAATVAAYLPFWFIEGDAVITETALTNAGRGRLPSFLMQNKAQLIEKGMFSYDKASLGSYKDFVPNRYSFGYWFAGAIREKYGSQIWSDVLTEISKKPFSITPFNRVLKKYSGKKKEQLYQDIFKKYELDWKKEIDELEITKTALITTKNKFHTNYSGSSILADSSIVALKESYDDISRIIKLKNGSEETVFTPGSIFRESFSARENLLIWSERRPDLRWSHADVSVIVLYNLDTKMEKSYRFKNKLFAPAISPDLNKFVAVEATTNNQYSLSVFDIYTGKKTYSFSTDDNQYFFTPCWNETGDKLYFIGLSENGKYLGELSLANGEIDILTPISFHDIRNPLFHSGKVYFTGSYTGIDNIFCCNIKDRNLKQLTSVPFGADHVEVLDDKLIFSSFSSNGYQLEVAKMSDCLWEEFNFSSSKTYKLAESLAQHEDTILSFEGASSAQFQSKRYSKLGHAFNFHSWSPLYVNVGDYEVKPGVSLFSQNKLGTAETELGYEYNSSEKSGKYKVGFKYSGFFPVFDSELSYGKRNSNYLSILNTVDENNNIIKSDTSVQKFSWKELELDLSIRLPLVFSQGKYTQLLQPSVDYSYRNVSHEGIAPENFLKGHYQSLSWQLYFQNIIRQSRLDIFPKWGQAFETVYRSSPFGGNKIGTLKAVKSYLYFPGLLNNHGVRFYNGYQEKKTEKTISFSDVIRYPRGSRRFHNTEMYSFAADYAFPIAYPDINIGPLAYIKRIRATLFYDYASLRGNSFDNQGNITGKYKGSLESLGVELYGDGHFLRLVAPVSAGLRGIYRPDVKEFSFEFLFSISFDDI